MSCPGSIKAIIIDDENHSIQTLIYELKRHCPQVQIIATYNSADDGKVGIHTYKPELVFLDIEMPVKNGFQMLRELDHFEFDVIFITAYDQYAIQAFRFAAVDYLLKPIISHDLVEAVQRISQKKEKFLTEQKLINLMQNLRKQKPVRIAIPHGNIVDFVCADNIVHCESDSNYTHIFSKDGRRYLLSKTMRELEEWLEPEDFFRCHHSHLINLKEIKQLIKNDGITVIMSNDMRIPVSRRRSEKFSILIKGQYWV